jgi:hypothetical protein
VESAGSDRVDMILFPFHLLLFSRGNTNFWKTVFSLAYFLQLGVVFGAGKGLDVVSQKRIWFSHIFVQMQRRRKHNNIL